MHEDTLVAKTEEMLLAYSVEARDGAKHPRMYKKAPTTKNDQVQNNNAKVEKSWSTLLTTATYRTLLPPALTFLS
jgi:hypothetical protein